MYGGPLWRLGDRRRLDKLQHLLRAQIERLGIVRLDVQPK
jgi:hypothetical protein